MYILFHWPLCPQGPGRLYSRETRPWSNQESNWHNFSSEVWLGWQSSPNRLHSGPTEGIRFCLLVPPGLNSTPMGLWPYLYKCVKGPSKHKFDYRDVTQTPFWSARALDRVVLYPHWFSPLSSKHLLLPLGIIQISMGLVAGHKPTNVHSLQTIFCSLSPHH